MNDPLKAKFNPQTGFTDNYFGGQPVRGNPNEPGSGHGHIRVNEQGVPSIIRDSYTPGDPFARRNATELDSRGPLNPLDPNKR